jgi:proline utilization trans-activator
MLRDEDVDVPLPSEDGLTAFEKDDFHSPCHIIAQLKLARITGDILNDIYRIPQPGRANDFVKSVQRILNGLSLWRDTLPPLLECNHGAVPMYSSRSVASLHLNFSQVRSMDYAQLKAKDSYICTDDSTVCYTHDEANILSRP